MSMNDDSINSGSKNDEENHSPPPEILAAEEERKTLGKDENRNVRKLRFVVLVALVLLGIGISLGVYWIKRSFERSTFETEFEAHALKVQESFNSAMVRKLGVINAFSSRITSYALEQGDEFPFVTVPNYEMTAMQSRILADGIRLDWLPLIEDSNRAAWEEYAKKEQGWMEEARARDTIYRNIQDERFGHTMSEPNDEDVLDGDIPATASDSFSEFIYGRPNQDYEVEANNTGPYLPIWQVSPVTQTRGILNFNLMTSFARNDVLATLQRSEAVLGMALALVDPSDPQAGSWSATYEKTLEIGQYRHTMDRLLGDPTSNLIFPVFDNFSTNRTIVGVVRTSLFWRMYFTDILPYSAEGLICVIENTLNQTFTYQIDGPQVTFLGPGDRHDHSYSAYGIEESMADTLKAAKGTTTWAYGQTDMDLDYCQYTLTVYPSSLMEELYRTSSPALFSSLVAIAFLFPIIVFLLFNWYVERRQRIVMERAVASGTIVSSIFPKAVRDRLMKQNQEKLLANNSNRDDSTQSVWKHGIDTKAVEDSAQPIADYFEESTIMFGDLVGFTAWSAKRSPAEVFMLLETIWNSFDQIALRRKVFKVETIGDCYVAVTGVPNAQPDHALIMAKFARECLLKLSELSVDLHHLLASNDGNAGSLRMRVGLHSGPVTAGVLRGPNSRFQLFGDAMNTAARMESHGEAGRIHISHTTADALIKAGKQDWVKEREDTINPKGKGEMQTYWLECSHASTAVTSQS